MEKNNTEGTKKVSALDRIPSKLGSDIRYLTFNVNGCKTIFNYHPWNQLRGSFNGFLQALNGDIVSLQELKIQSDAVSQLGLLENYRSFVSVPKVKKGYSGVGLFIRIPRDDESPQIKQALTVLKAEEGISGRLKDGSKGVRYCDLLDEESIGGYLSQEEMSELEVSEQDMTQLDSEGRCSVVELANNTVVFSLYCPANSMGTPEGQIFRLNFLEVMFRRCANLQRLGKKVVVMGDINVSPDLIDSAESINELIKNKVVFNNLREGGDKFEKKNETACLSFQSSTSHRCILHRYTLPSLSAGPKYATQFLHDTTRHLQKRKLALYTVWNTMTNSRQSNFGSRIDLILISSEEDVNHLSKADILPFLHGSDHCPVMTDLNVDHQEVKPYSQPKRISFEAKNFYKLAKHRDISTMFLRVSAKRNVDSDSQETDSSSTSNSQGSMKKMKVLSEKITYKSRKSVPKSTQQPINNFFFRESIELPMQTEESDTSQSGEKVDVVSKFVSLVYDEAPLCHHNEQCVLKTSNTQSSKGKKFWCCGRSSKGSTTELGEHRCNFFEWTKKPTETK